MCPPTADCEKIMAEYLRSPSVWPVATVLLLCVQVCLYELGNPETHLPLALLMTQWVAWAAWIAFGQDRLPVRTATGFTLCLVASIMLFNYEFYQRTNPSGLSDEICTAFLILFLPILVCFTILRLVLGIRLWHPSNLKPHRHAQNERASEHESRTDLTTNEALTRSRFGSPNELNDSQFGTVQILCITTTIALVIFLCRLESAFSIQRLGLVHSFRLNNFAMECANAVGLTLILSLICLLRVLPKRLNVVLVFLIAGIAGTVLNISYGSPFPRGQLIANSTTHLYVCLSAFLLTMRFCGYELSRSNVG